jgi:hypothetical protein
MACICQQKHQTSGDCASFRVAACGQTLGSRELLLVAPIVGSGVRIRLVAPPRGTATRIWRRMCCGRYRGWGEAAGWGGVGEEVSALRLGKQSQMSGDSVSMPPRVTS